MGYWSVLLPESSDVTNMVANPSVELATTGFTAVGGTIVRASEQSRRGGYSLRVEPTAGVNDGVYFGTVALGISQNYTFSVDMRGYVGIPYKIWFGDLSGNLKGTAVTHTGTGEWARLSVTWMSDADASFRLYVTKNNNASTGYFYIDGLLCVNKSYDVRYFDGNCEDAWWTGEQHASTSVISAQSRKQGRWYDMTADLGLTVLAEMGHGMAPAKHLVQGQALLPGALFAGRKTLPRTIDLLIQAKGSSYSNLATLRKGLVEKVKPHLVKGDQPFRMKYTGANSARPLEIEAVYDSGLEGGNADMYLEEFTLRCMAYDDPFWNEDGSQACHLTAQQILTSTNYIVGRVAGVWQKLATGVNDAVVAIRRGPDGLLYVVGWFTTASGTTVNRIAKWNGTAWSTVGGTSCNGNVYDLLFAPDGTLYICGDFTLAPDGTAANRIAKWNGTAWSALGTGLSAACLALAIGLDGSIYAGGDFVTAGGTTVNKVAKWDGSAWSAMGSTPGVAGGAAPLVYALAVGIDGAIYVGGAFVTAGGVTVNNIAKWSGTAWSALSTGADDQVNVLAVDTSGLLYMGGRFTAAGGVTVNYVAKWNGQQWSALGSGLGAQALFLAYADGLLYAHSNDFYSSARVAVLVWNGSCWAHLDAVYPLAAGLNALELTPLGDLYFGSDSATTVTTGYQTEVTNSGSERSYPKLVVKSSLAASVYYLHNQTTGKTLWFDYNLLAGETLTLELTPGKRSCKSSYYGDVWRAVLRNSDLADFCLLPGINKIDFFMDYSGSPTITAYLEWPLVHESADGAAA